VDQQVGVLQGRVALTVHNDSAQTIHVRMDGKSISGIVEKDLAPGDSLRAAGHTLASSQDVSGTITYPNGDKVPFWGYNPDIGYPSVGFGNGSNWERFSVGETQQFSEGGHSFSVHRNGDLDIGGGKDFQISVK
jgi:outer membrane receptor for ferric coprogen and ferric-rhodotorulic acid